MPGNVLKCLLLRSSTLRNVLKKYGSKNRRAASLAYRLYSSQANKKSNESLVENKKGG
jgi:hypothetical protein